MSTYTNFNHFNRYDNSIRTLPTDQQKLADAAANQGSEDAAGMQGVYERTANLSDASSTGGLLNKVVSKFTKYNPKAIINSATQLNPNDKTAAKVLRGVARGVFGTGKGSPKGIGRANLLATIGNVASEVYRPFDEKGRSGYQASGEFGGTKLGEAIFGDTSQPPMTASERKAIDMGLNPLSPIKFNPSLSSSLVSSTSSDVAHPYYGPTNSMIGYEPMAQKSEEELAAAANEEYASQFKGVNQGADGSYTGLTRDGEEQLMTPEQYASYDEQKKLGLADENAVQMGEYTPVAGTQGFVQQPLGYTPPANQLEQTKRELAVAAGNERLQSARSGGGLSDAAQIVEGKMPAPEGFYNPAPAKPYVPQEPIPRAPQVTKQMEAASNFKDAREAGNITADKVARAEEYAASMGRTFDRELGYSKDFDQSILDKYNAEIGTGGQGDQRGVQRNARQALGRSSYFTESDAREARLNARPDFGSAQIRNSEGEMVEATKENRFQRDLERGYKQEAREAGYTAEQTRTYVADKLRERSESISDREFELKVRKQNFSQGEANLARTLKGLQEGTDVEEEDYFNIVSELGKLGVGIDTETGNLTYNKEDAGFAWFDKEVNLTPDSELYNKIMQMKGGAQFLAPPMYVQEAAKTAKEGDVIVSDDGTKRAYKVINGKLVQVK